MVELNRDPNALANTVLDSAPAEEVKAEEPAPSKKEGGKPAAARGLSTENANALLDRKVNE